MWHQFGCADRQFVYTRAADTIPGTHKKRGYSTQVISQDRIAGRGGGACSTHVRMNHPSDGRCDIDWRSNVTCELSAARRGTDWRRRRPAVKDETAAVPAPLRAARLLNHYRHVVQVRRSRASAAKRGRYIGKLRCGTVTDPRRRDAGHASYRDPDPGRPSADVTADIGAGMRAVSWNNATSTSTWRTRGSSDGVLTGEFTANDTRTAPRRQQRRSAFWTDEDVAFYGRLGKRGKRGSSQQIDDVRLFAWCLPRANEPAFDGRLNW